LIKDCQQKKKIKEIETERDLLKLAENQATWEKNAAENQREGVGVDCFFF